MTDCSRLTCKFSSIKGKKIITDFGGGKLTSDAGVLLLRELDKCIGLIDAMAEWLEQNILEGSGVFSLPEEHRKRMRTTNMLELLNEEVKRRRRVAGLFANEASLVRLVGAILMETYDNWQPGKRYLNMNMENPDLASDKTRIYRKDVA